MNGLKAGVLLAILTLLVCNTAALADTMYLQGDQSLNSGSNIGGNTASDGTGAAVNKSWTSSGPYLYEFGVGATGGGTPALGGFVGGLDLQSHKLYTTNGTSFSLDMGGYDLYGDSSTTSLSTYGSANPTGSIVVQNVGVVDLGVVTTVNTYTVRGDSGIVTIGSSSVRAGALRIDRIDTYKPATTYKAGNVTIYSSGSVQIKNDSGTAGDINAYATGRGGNILIDSLGAFIANDLNAYVAGNTGSANPAGNITLTGNGSGVLSLHSINAYVASANTWGVNANSVAVSGYTSAHLTGDILTSNNSTGTHNDKKGGNISITGITGDIRIDGTVDADSTSSTDGSLTLAAGGEIKLAGLDLSKLLFAALDAGGYATVSGQIIGADGNPLAAAGNGTLSNGASSIRASAGYYVFYDPALNPDLSNATFELLQLNGASGGGYLVPLANVPEPATLALLSLGGLAMAGGAVRRRRN